jgi:hypothetical protein
MISEQYRKNTIRCGQVIRCYLRDASCRDEQVYQAIIEAAEARGFGLIVMASHHLDLNQDCGTGH